MFVSDTLSINDLGHLTIAGRDAVELANTFGTPLYVYDEDMIRQNCRSYRTLMKKYYGGASGAAFASKAFCCKAMCAIAKEEGMFLDVVSEGELYTALNADFPAERLIFHGNNKTVKELLLAVENGVGRVVADNFPELDLLDQLAKSQGKVQNILLRLKPGIDAHTHKFISTGQEDSRFGFAITGGDAMAAVKAAQTLSGINLIGIHCHIGSQIVDIEPFQQAAKVMVSFLADVLKETGVTLYELNLGGGYAVRYTSNDVVPAIENYIKAVSGTVRETCKELGLTIPTVLIEPGRSVVAQAGVTLYTAGAVKEIKNIRTYVSVDGGMTDNPRYALYGAEYETFVANKAELPRDKMITLAGKCCETGDIIGEKMPSQPVSPGDIIAVAVTGAYNYAMSSNYNRSLKPAVVFIREGSARVVVKRETLSDLIRNDL